MPVQPLADVCDELSWLVSFMTSFLGLISVRYSAWRSDFIQRLTSLRKRALGDGSFVAVADDRLAHVIRLPTVWSIGGRPNGG